MENVGEGRPEFETAFWHLKLLDAPDIDTHAHGNI